MMLSSLSSRHREAIQAFLENLKRELPDAEAYLFGSLARGDWLEDSDVDIIVVTDRLAAQKSWERTAKLRRLAPANMGFDIIALTREEFRSAQDGYDKLIKLL